MHRYKNDLCSLKTIKLMSITETLWWPLKTDIILLMRTGCGPLYPLPCTAELEAEVLPLWCSTDKAHWRNCIARQSLSDQTPDQLSRKKMNTEGGFWDGGGKRFGPRKVSWILASSAWSLKKERKGRQMPRQRIHWLRVGLYAWSIIVSQDRSALAVGLTVVLKGCITWTDKGSR